MNDGRVHTIGMDLSVGPDVAVHHAAGLSVLPGGVHAHASPMGVRHLATVDTFRHGNQGGGVRLYDNGDRRLQSEPRGEPAHWARGFYRRRVNACVDVGAHMILLEVNAQSLADIKTLIDREGVSSFKPSMAYPGVLMVDDGAPFQAMRALAPMAP